MAKVDNFSKDELEQIVKESNNYKEVLLRLGYSSGSGNSYKTIQQRLNNLNISTTHFKEYHSIQRTEENVFCENSSASQSVLRRWYEKGNYTEYKCAICGLEPFWNGKELTLTLDHINGINGDNRLNNLRWVCPNCDRQLPTYSRGNKGLIPEEQKERKRNYCIDCGKEISLSAKRCNSCAKKLQEKIVPNRPNRAELKQMIRNMSFVAIGKKYGVSDNAIRKWCKAENLPIKKTDIKSYTDKEWELI